MVRAIAGWAVVAVFVVAGGVVIAGCDAGPPDVVQVLEGTADGAGVILMFDVVLAAGTMPIGTPLEGLGLRVGVGGRDVATGRGSSGQVIDVSGFAFDNATDDDPGPFLCDETACRARFYGFVAGVEGDTLDYSIRVAYAPDGYDSNPDINIDVIEVQEAPVREVAYTVPTEEFRRIAGKVIEVTFQPPALDSPVGWVGVRSGEIWPPSSGDPAFAPLIDGYPQASEIVFANVGWGSPSMDHRLGVKGWLASETNPVVTITNEIDHDRSVTEIATSVADEYQVAIDYPSRDLDLPLMVNLEWVGDEFEQFRIDDGYAGSRLETTTAIADLCRGTSCSFHVSRVPNASLENEPPSELSVTVVPWGSETNPGIDIKITN